MTKAEGKQLTVSSFLFALSTSPLRVNKLLRIKHVWLEHFPLEQGEINFAEVREYGRCKYEARC